MKLDQRTLEILCLSALTKSTRCVDKALSRKLSSSHFVFIESNEKLSLTNLLFSFIVKYYSESGGSLVTSLVLDVKFREHKVSDSLKRKFITLWDEIENTEFNENEFHQIVTLLKNNQGLRNLTDAFTSTSNHLANGELKSSIEIIQKKIDEILDFLHKAKNGEIPKWQLEEMQENWAKEKEINLFRTKAKRLVSLAINGFMDDSETSELLGCNYVNYMVHLSKQFDKKMSFENKKLWEVDHICPISKAMTIDEIKVLSKFTNLRPLWKSHNRKKSSKDLYLL